MIQGVRDVFEIVDLPNNNHATQDGDRESKKQQEGKMVLIGRGLDKERFERSLRLCLENAGGL